MNTTSQPRISLQQNTFILAGIVTMYNTSKCGLRPHLLRFVAHRGLPTGLGALCLKNSLINTPLVTACHRLFTYHCQSLLERVSVIIAGKSKIAEVVVYGGGIRGGPVAIFAQTTSSHSWLQHHAPRHAPVPNRMQLVRNHYFYQLIVKQTISTCHRQFIYTTYHCQSSLEELEHNLHVTAGRSY